MSLHMSVEGLRVEYKPPVCVITMENSEERNRLTEPALDALLRMAESCRLRNDIHVVLIQSKCTEWFCSGLLNPGCVGR